MKFRMTHIMLEDNPAEEFTEEDPPSWLVSYAYDWWWEEYILKLEVGESIKSDFRKIERIA